MANRNFKAYIIWFVGSAFYLYQYFIRVIPSVIEHDLETNFLATAAQVATAVGMYLLVYAPMQLVVGVLFDTIGVRKLFLHAATLLTVSCLLPLIPADTLFYFGLGRAFMGLASAFSFVGVMYLCTQWFPREKLAMLSGLTSGLGVLGAILAQSWLPKLKAEYGYNNIWIISVIVGLIVVAFIFKYIPKDKTAPKAERQTSVWTQCKEHIVYIGKQWRTWNIGLITGALYMPFAVFADFLSFPYFTKICSFSSTQAAILVAILNLSWAIGSPIVGWISDIAQSRKIPLVVSGFLTALSFALLLLCHGTSFGVTAFLMALIGVCAGGQAIGFIACAELNPEDTHASSIAFINMIVMGFCGFAQVLIGHSISFFKSFGQLSFAYQMGLGLVSVLTLVCSILFLLYFNDKAQNEKEQR
ncbi:MAG: MFS transporter [bacterium]